MRAIGIVALARGWRVVERARSRRGEIENGGTHEFVGSGWQWGSAQRPLDLAPRQRS